MKTALIKRLAFSVAAFALVAGAGFGLLTESTDAGPAYAKYITYYSSPAKTTIVGSYEIDCWGNVLSFGSKTRYNDEYLIPCF